MCVCVRACSLCTVLSNSNPHTNPNCHPPSSPRAPPALPCLRPGTPRSVVWVDVDPACEGELDFIRKELRDLDAAETGGSVTKAQADIARQRVRI